MGFQYIDKYTYLHFASGIVAYYWKLNFWQWIVLHTIFEILENSSFGMNVINKVGIWPGNKLYADSLKNIIGDTLGAGIGWYSAYLVSIIYDKRYSVYESV